MQKRGQKTGIMQGQEDKRGRLFAAAFLYSTAFIVSGLYTFNAAYRWRKMSKNGSICAFVDMIGGVGA